MIYEILPYIYIIGAGLDVLLMGTAALIAHSANIDSKGPFTLALIAASITWGATASIALNPMPEMWQYSGSLAMWIPMSIIAVVLLWALRPPASEPPAPPPVYPKINGQFRPPSQQRTYRLRTRKS